MAIFHVRKNKELQPRLLCPARLSFKMEGKIRSFPDKKKKKRIKQYISGEGGGGGMGRKGIQM